MTNSNDAAFPSDPISVRDARNGLTKREWFAGMALITCSSPEVLSILKQASGDENEKAVAKWVISIADALIAKLSKEVKA